MESSGALSVEGMKTSAAGSDLLSIKERRFWLIARPKKEKMVFLLPQPILFISHFIKSVLLLIYKVRICCDEQSPRVANWSETFLLCKFI